MQYFLKGLEWAYILICFAAFWYLVLLLCSTWGWLFNRNGFVMVGRSAVKLAVTLLLAWIVIWLGVISTAGQVSA